MRAPEGTESLCSGENKAENGLQNILVEVIIFCWCIFAAWLRETRRLSVYERVKSFDGAVNQCCL
jgi:hypothetical protein